MCLVVLLAVLGVAYAQDYCYCSTRNSVKVRSYACGDWTGTANKDGCFEDLRSYRNCTHNGNTYLFHKIRFNSEIGWIADTFVRRTPCQGSAADNGAISPACMNCICQVESHCGCADCKWDVTSLSCGPYQIKEMYHKDCYNYDRSTISDWKTCTTGSPGNSCTNSQKARACSDKCVRAYTSRYGSYCTGGRQPTCQDYARIHNGGPKGCQRKSTLSYWLKVKACCDRTGGC